ncbi:PAS domain-containing protein [Pyxidicoccus fallax]|uniref:histidine kinase n=1 Tax=Pyxidicoccus fallax TaxID=394095 RepID=A0A848LDZ5_9BACT|nr:ATP-binding protein [Pyxidicoccus fallax]NMO15023.1 PAS domain-containing protein [Pyxidicoccus fallax]NPC82651.1 PAS domain-containing protein [Pyxidicoccus fallax]
MRSSVLPALLLLGVLAGTVLGVVHFIQRDRRALVDQFARERWTQLQEGVRGVSDALEDTGDDLRFAGELLSQPGTREEHRRELRALLEAVGQYKAILVFGPDGHERLRLLDRRTAASMVSQFAPEDLAPTVVQALRNPPGHIASSPPLPRATSGWLRAFATALPEDAPDGGGAIVVLVDTEPLFAPLKLLASDTDTHLFSLGAHGTPTALSAPSLLSPYARLGTDAHLTPGLDALARRMRLGEAGSLLIEREEAARLGLGDAEVVATFSPVRFKNGAHWPVATLASTRVLRSHERGLVLRLSLAALLIAVFLIAFGVYVVLARSRAVALRESRRHAERLAHLHDKTQKILDNIPTGVLALSEQGRITAANRALAARMPPDAVGGTLAAAFPHASEPVLQRLEELVTAARWERHVRSLHGEPLRLFEEEGQYNVHAVPLEPGAADVCTLLVVEDLSDVRALEGQLLRAEKLATVGVLAAGIAHEIGTPLGIIRGRAEYVRGKLGPEHPQGPGLDSIIEQIDRVSRTLRQLLDFSRFQPAEARAVALAPLVHGVRELLSVEAERRHVRLQVDVAPRLPPVAADPDQLQQVLVNLVLNAYDACARGGHVRLGVDLAGGDTPGAWGLVRMTVEDDGCGIAPKHLHQIFDPFFTTKKRGQGTGLGLAMVAHIVRNHGGRIELDSAPERGTRFTVLWPAAAPLTEERHAI